MAEIRNEAGLTQREHRLATGIATECGFCNDGRITKATQSYHTKPGDVCPHCHGSGLAPMK